MSEQTQAETPLARLLAEGPRAIGVGVEQFAAELRPWDADVVTVDWRPPAAGAAPDAVTLAWNTTLLASLYDGVARAAQGWLCAYLAERAPANLGAPLASLSRFQEAVGENERLLAVNRRLLRSAAAETDAGAPPSVAESGLIKLTVTENAIQVVQGAVALVGNPGLSRKNPLERHLRDVLCARIHTPQGDAVRLAAGRAALGI